MKHMKRLLKSLWRDASWDDKRLDVAGGVRNVAEHFIEVSGLIRPALASAAGPVVLPADEVASQETYKALLKSKPKKVVSAKKCKAIEDTHGCRFQTTCTLIWRMASACGLHCGEGEDQFPPAKNMGNNIIFLCAAVIKACNEYCEFKKVGAAHTCCARTPAPPDND